MYISEPTVGENVNISFCEGMNITTISQLSSYEQNKTTFIFIAFVCTLIAFIGIIGNGLVIKVSHRTRNTGRLSHLDSVIKSLAITDFLFGLLGTPLIMINYYMGKPSIYTINKFTHFSNERH